MPKWVESGTLRKKTVSLGRERRNDEALPVVRMVASHHQDQSITDPTVAKFIMNPLRNRVVDGAEVEVAAVGVAVAITEDLMRD
jgi:hypothetical protein